MKRILKRWRNKTSRIIPWFVVVGFFGLLSMSLDMTVGCELVQYKLTWYLSTFLKIDFLFGWQEFVEDSMSLCQARFF